mgnify:CR=1 FL=1
MLFAIYNSRNYLGIIALKIFNASMLLIYNSRNYLGIIAEYERVVRYVIYNSRNYLGIIASIRVQRYKKYSNYQLFKEYYFRHVIPPINKNRTSQIAQLIVL